MKIAYKKVYFKECKFFVPNTVYEPSEDSFLIAENLSINKGDKVLDMGTGCGINAIISAIRTSFVVAVDINPHAARCTKQNAKMNGVEDRIEIICSDLFKSLKIGVCFDLILFNAPYLPIEDKYPVNWIDRAWQGGDEGREVIDRFIALVPEFLCPGGRVLLIQSTISNIETTLLKFMDKGFEARILAEHKISFETISLVEAVKNSNR